MTDRTTQFLAKVVASNHTRWFSVPMLNRIVIHHDVARAALAHPGVAVPYGPGSGVLDLDFVLSETDPGAHAAKRALVHQALAAGAAEREHGLVRAHAVAEAAVRDAVAAGQGADARLDAVTGLIHPAVEAWAMEWLGLPQEFGPRAHLMSQLVMHRIFFNPAFPGGKPDTTASAAAVRATTAFLEDIRTVLAGSAAKTGILGHLAATGLPSHVVESNMVGLTVGPMALACLTMVRSLEALLAIPTAERNTILQSYAADDRGQRALFLELARLHPPAPVFVRHAATRIEIRNEMRPLRTHGTMIIAVKAAMLDPRMYANPTQLQPDRFLHASGPHLAFGGGMHACMGTDAYAELVPRVLGPVLRSGALRADGPVVAADPPFTGASRKARKSWTFPGSFPIRFAARS